jgi:hypothetical protein
LPGQGQCDPGFAEELMGLAQGSADEMAAVFERLLRNFFAMRR